MLEDAGCLPMEKEEIRSLSEEQEQGLEEAQTKDSILGTVFHEMVSCGKRGRYYLLCTYRKIILYGKLNTEKKNWRQA